MLKKPLLKIIVLGDSGVGKTSLLDRYVNKKFNSIYRATIGADFYAKEVLLGDKILTLQIWDTVGQERFKSLGVLFYRGADGVVLVYDVTNRSSFQSIESWKNEFLVYGAPKDPRSFPFVVIANKIDLGKRDFVQSEIQDLLDCDYEVPVYETSAKDNVNVEEAFADIAQMALDREPDDALFNPFPEMTDPPAETSNRCYC